MISTIISNVLAFFTNTSWLTKILTVVIIWFTPALELFVLLLCIMFIDYLLDLWAVYKNSKPTDNTKAKLWEVTKLFLTKVFFYSILVILMNGLQLHLVKESFNLFRWVIAIPIISESFSIMSTIETYTGIKVIDSIKKVFKNMLSKEGIDETIVDDLDKDNTKKQ